MSQLIAIGVLLGGVVAGLLAFAPQVSEWLVRARARRLPRALAERMEEEWLAEVEALASRASQLAFAIALTLTRRHSFAIEEDVVATMWQLAFGRHRRDAELCGVRLRRLVPDPADVSLDIPDSGGAVANAGGIRRREAPPALAGSPSTDQGEGIEPVQPRPHHRRGSSLRREPGGRRACGCER